MRRSLRDVLEAGIRHHGEQEPTGAPPPLGSGSGRLWLVVPNMVDDSGTVVATYGVLMVKETHHGDTWSPPGGNTSSKDHSTLHAALREFREETGARSNPEGLVTSIAATCPAPHSCSAQYVRINPRIGEPRRAHEDWALVLKGPKNLDTRLVETYLWGYDPARASWTDAQKSTKHLSSETGGYIWMDLEGLARWTDPSRKHPTSDGKKLIVLRDSKRIPYCARSILFLLSTLHMS